MSFVTVATVASLGATAYGAITSYQAAKTQEESYKAQAEFEAAETERRIKEERARTSQNLIRAQEEKRKALAKQRAAFVKAGVLPDSESARFVIGELGENLQTRIQDMFLQASDRQASIRAQGNSNIWNAQMNARASSRQATSALVSGFESFGTQVYRANDIGLFGKKKGASSNG